MAATISSTLFGNSVKRILDSWTVLQLAVSNSFGGRDSREKAEWLVCAVETWFTENCNIEPYEVEDFLSVVMDNEFDTYVDDGSLSEISRMICGCYKLYQEGRHKELQDQLQCLQPSRLEQCARAPSNDDSEDELSTCQVPQQLPSTSQQTETTVVNEMVSDSVSNPEDMETNEDGWHVVCRGGKRK